MMNDSVINTLQFYDIIRLFCLKIDIEYMATKLMETYQYWGLKINSTKPIYPVFNVSS